MKKETFVVLVIVGFAVLTSGFIWFRAWPALKSQTFPDGIERVVLVDASGQQSYVLNNNEMKILEIWLNSHPNSWGPLFKSPLIPADAVLCFYIDNWQFSSHVEPTFLIRVWKGLRAGSWDNTLVLEMDHGNYTKILITTRRDFSPIRDLIDAAGFKWELFK